MDEFTFPMRKGESAYMPQRILVIRIERTSARVEENGEGDTVMEVKKSSKNKEEGAGGESVNIIKEEG